MAKKSSGMQSRIFTYNSNIENEWIILHKQLLAEALQEVPFGQISHRGGLSVLFALAEQAEH